MSNRKLLSPTDFDGILREAWYQVGKHPGYRLGQAIWNLLPAGICDTDVTEQTDHYKLYNSNDANFCLEYCAKNYINGTPSWEAHNEIA